MQRRIRFVANPLELGCPVRRAPLGAGRRSLSLLEVGANPSCLGVMVRCLGEGELGGRL